MKLNFIEKRKQEKEAIKRQKEEAARRKAEEDKKKNKKLLIGAAALFAVLLIVAGIGSLTEKNPGVSSNPPAAETSISNADTSSTTSESEISEPASIEPTQEVDSTPEESQTATSSAAPATSFSASDIPAYSGSGAYVAINNNVPYFTDADYTTTAFENYSSLDSLGRCGVAYANVCKETMPTEERGSIGQVKPSGWHTVKYDCVDGKYLYNRCHLIGYQLSAENANTKNLITGTRYLNVDGMLPFENMVADYIKETNNHVLYRVTPIFDGNNLVATGVLMEALSVEDKGDGICFNVFCYNVQPGVTVDYATGDSSLDGTAATTTPEPAGTTPATGETTAPATQPSTGTTYILNTNTHKFHYPTCSSVGQMSDANKQEYTGSRDDLIAQGYEPCKRCNP